MKKKAILLLALALAALLITLSLMSGGGKNKIAELVKAGGRADNFILGMKNSAAFSLKDLAGKYTVILAFTGEDNPSRKFLEKAREKLGAVLAKRSDIIWFNIRMQKPYCVIEELTGKFGLKYRTALSKLPASYHFRDLPAVIIIDRDGTITFVYIGYSPTMADDLKAGLGE